MSELKISIITVSYNNKETIEDTILSVKGQDYPNVEYIVVDGASNDGTVEILKSHQNNISHIITEPDDGIYYAMNKGIDLASGDVIGFINADDVLASPQVLSNVARVMQDESLDSCFSDLVYVRPNDLDKVVRFWQSSPFSVESFSDGWSPPHPTFYVKRKIYEEFGKFDLNYHMGNDIELMMRFLERYRISTLYIPQVWVKMRLGGVSNNSLQNIFTQNKEIIRSARSNRVPLVVHDFIIGKLKDRVSQYVWHWF